MSTSEELFARAQAGDQASIGRVLTLVEQGGPRRDELLRLLSPHTGRAHRIGVAGPPGAGKSTLINQLARRFAARDDAQVGVVAVDPSSPQTGGALLGDRVRMSELESHDRIFIRSLSTRGQTGGLSLATGLVADAMDALGFDPILMETVGVGQAELDVMRKAHSVALLLLPGTGDGVQLMKAGLLEVADILVVNKADRDGAKELGVLVESELHSRAVVDGGWATPVLMTCAYRGEGVDEVVEVMRQHRTWLETSGEFEARTRASIELQLRQLVEHALLARLWHDDGFGSVLRDHAADVAAHRTDLAAAVHALSDRISLPGEGS